MENLENEWIEIEAIFSDLVEQSNFDLPITLETIRELRSLGHSKFLRPGSSMYMFILSRSKNYELNDEQCRISISPGKNRFNIEDGEVQIHVRNLNGKTDNFKTKSPLDNEKFLFYLNELINSPIT